MKRYLWLLVLVLAAAFAVSALARLPRGVATRVAPAAPAPVVELTLEVGEQGMTPRAAAVPKGHRVRLSVRNATARPLSLRLAGYEHAVTIESLPPGSTWRGEFLAELPGEDFAWIAGDRPIGRLGVTGSHMVEGHR